MKILQVFGGGVRSGVESYVATVAAGLGERGMKTILAPLRDGPFRREAEALGLNVRRTGKRFRGDPYTISSLVKIIKEEEIDIVHTHAENGDFYGRIAAKIAGAPRLTSTIHTFYRETLRDRYSWAWMRNLIYRQDILTSSFCDKIITVSGAIKRQVASDGVAEDKIVVVPNGVIPDQYDCEKDNRAKILAELGLTGDERIAGAVGRLSPVKNIEALLLAAKKTTPTVPKARFLIVGDGPRRGRLEEMAARLGIEKRVIFAGWQADIKEYLSIMDVFVIPSLIEGSSFAILEAMALGKPVIATDVGGNPELVADGETGFLVGVNDSDALADRMAHLLASEDKASAMGRAGRKRLEANFTERQMLDKTADVYAGLMGMGA